MKYSFIQLKVFEQCNFPGGGKTFDRGLDFRGKTVESCTLFIVTCIRTLHIGRAAARGRGGRRDGRRC